MKISCLGPDGSYSHLAVKNLCPNAKVMLCRTFSQAVNELINGNSDGVILPIENSIQGGVLQNLDLLQKSEGLCAVKEYVLKIDHRLAYMEGAKKEDIKVIYSHQQALSQCAEYLRANFPDARLVNTNSTSESLEMISDFSAAGIVGSHMKKSGMVMSPENIADETSNFTHFLLVKSGYENIETHTSKMFFSAVCKHRPGTLLKLLQVIYVYDLNMTKIESRPIKSSPGEYRFFIEFEGDYSDWKVKKAIEDIKAECRSFKLIGAY